MTITEYLNTKPMVRVRRGLGGESDWLEFCILKLPSGILYVMDPAYLPDDIEGFKIELFPSDYTLSGKVITYWKDSRISRLRITANGQTPTLGTRIGEVVTDHGFIGVADEATFFRVWEHDREAFQRGLSEKIPESGPCKIATLGGRDGVVVPFVESGFGDGSFEIYALENAGKRVGVEVVFITPEQQYPF